MAIKLPTEFDGTEQVLTVGHDNLKGTDDNDLFISEGGDDLNTLTSSDILNGKGGNGDVHRYSTDGGGSIEVGGWRQSNIETFEVSNYADYLNMYMDKVSGLKTIWLNGTAGGEAYFYNIGDDIDVAVYGSAGTSDNGFYFADSAYAGDSDTMQLQLKGADTDIMVDSDGGVEKIKIFSKGSTENYVDLDVDGLTKLKIAKGSTDIDVDVDSDNVLSEIKTNKKFTGDLDIGGDGDDYYYGYSAVIGTTDGSAVKVTGAKGDDTFDLAGDEYYDYDEEEYHYPDLVMKTKKGADDVDLMYLGDVELNLGGGANDADIYDVDNALVTAGNGMDDIDVSAYGRVQVDAKNGDNYIDAWAGSAPIASELFPDLPANIAVKVDTGDGNDDIWVGTGDYGEDGNNDAEVNSGGGDDMVNIVHVEGAANIKTQGNDDDIRTGWRGISEDDVINGGNGMDVLFAGSGPNHGNQNGFNVLNYENAFAGVSNVEAVSIMDRQYIGEASFDGVYTGANDAGIAHYLLAFDNKYDGVSSGLQSSYDLDNMIGGVTIDINVMGEDIDYFNLDLDDDADDKSANINFFSSAYHPDINNFRNVTIEDTETLNIGLTDVPHGEEGEDDEPGFVAFGNYFDGGVFYDASDELTEINVAGDLHFGSAIAAGALDTFDGSGMTGSAILGFLDVSDEGITVETGSGHDVVIGEDEVEYDISTGDGADVVAIFHEEAIVDFINTGDGDDIAFAGLGNDEISMGAGDDVAFFLGEDLTDADIYDGGADVDTAVVMGGVGSPMVSSESQFMNRWTNVENLVLGEDSDYLLLNAIADDAGIEQVDLSMGGFDELEVGSGFDNDLKVLLSAHYELSHPLLEAHGFFGEDFDAYNGDDVVVDAGASNAELTVVGEAMTFGPGDVFKGGMGDSDSFVVIADDYESWAIFGEDTEGFESLDVQRTMGYDVGVVMHNNNVAEGQTFVVDASDLIDDPSGEDDHDAGEFYFDGEDETDTIGEDDEVIEEAGAFDVTGGQGDDEIYTGDGDDTVDGGDGDDYIYTGNGDDTVDGGDGDDEIWAGAGDDTVDGGDGDDDITGGTGADELTGGADDDWFYYETLEDSSGGSEFIDTITDFEGGPDADTGDKINLEDFGSDLAWAGNGDDLEDSEARLIADDGIIEIVYNMDTGSLWVNLNDDESLGNGDLRINMDGVDSMTEFDFVLA